jgi:hypothetical protein
MQRLLPPIANKDGILISKSLLKQDDSGSSFHRSFQHPKWWVSNDA